MIEESFRSGVDLTVVPTRLDMFAICEVLYEFRCYPRMRAKEPRPAGGRRLHPFVSWPLSLSDLCAYDVPVLLTQSTRQMVNKNNIEYWDYFEITDTHCLIRLGCHLLGLRGWGSWGFRVCRVLSFKCLGFRV